MKQHQSPDGYITTAEAARVHGINPKRMLQAAMGRSWGAVQVRRRGDIRVFAYDIDDVLDWHYGLEKKEPKRECLGGCGDSAVPGTHFCGPCDRIRCKRSGESDVRARSTP